MKADRDEASPYAAMLAAQDVAVRCKVSLAHPIIAEGVEMRMRSANPSPTLFFFSHQLTVGDGREGLGALDQATSYGGWEQDQ